MRLKWYCFLKMFFHLIYEVFWQIRKFFKLEKLENMMKKHFFEKKRFHLLKKLLYQNGKAQNMPMVAGRLVLLVRFDYLWCGSLENFLLGSESRELESE